MFKKSLLIMLLMAMFAPWAANAQVYKYVPVTSLDQITTNEGDAYVIACPTENWQYGATSSFSSGNLTTTTEQVVFNGANITDIKTAAEWILEKVDGTDSQYYIKNGSDYLGSNSSKSLRVTTNTYGENYWKWAIAINDGVLTITNVMYNDYKLLIYNNYSNIKFFRLYNSTYSCQNIGLYKKTEDTNPTITVSPATAKIMENGTVELSATVHNVEDTPTINWSTSNASIASISANTGSSITVTGENEGVATVTASIIVNEIEYTSTCEVNVSNDILIQNGSITTCTGTFYDDGGTANYGNSKNFTFTIYPETNGNMIQVAFSSFAVENYSTDPDYLEIYDGTTTSAPLLKKYKKEDNGTTFTEVATNNDGALTFHFVSDGSGVASGWVATISCVAPAAYELSSASNVTHNSAIVNWTGGTSDFIVEYKKHSDNEWTIASTTVNIRFYELTDLDPETAYDVRVTDANNNVITEENYFTTPAIPIVLTSPTDITSTTATVNWTGGKANFTLEYKIHIAPDWTVAATNLATRSYELTNLAAQTSYDVRVTDAIGSTLEEMMYFTTSCGAYTLPYSYGFENNELVDFECWTLVDTHIESTRSTAAKYEGSYGFQFYYNTTPPQYLITPELAGTKNGITVEFYYKNYSTYFPETFYVGYATEAYANDMSIFDFGDETDDLITASDGQWHHYMKHFPASTKQIAFKLVSNDKSRLYIDNVVIKAYDKVFTGDGEPLAWDYSTNWTPNGLPTVDDDVLINDAVIIRTTPSYVDAATANTITFGTNGSLTIADGGQLVHPNPVNATLQKTITGASTWNEEAVDGWYTITPTVASYDKSNFGEVGTYDLYLYNEPTHYWWNANGTDHSFSSMAAGRGYLFASETEKTISYTGEMQGTSDYVSTELSNTESAGYMKGFNLVGNRFTRNLVSGDVKLGDNPLTTYYVAEGGSDLVARDLTSNPIKPGQGFIVQANGQSHIYYNSSNAKGAMAYKPAFIRIEAGNERFMDRAYVQIGQGNTLRKMTLSDGVSHLYVMDNGKDYAAVTIEEAQGEMPINFKANENGTYTLTVKPEGVEMNYLHLVDNMTGMDVDLLQTPSYTFNAKTTDYESRFRLVFAANNNTNDNSEEASFAFFSNGSWIINNEGEATLQVIDLNGRILSSETINGSVSTSINATTGIYMVRLISGDNVKTQKVVVR